LAGLYFFIFISRLPFFILYGISDVLFFFLYYVFGYRRKIVLRNLKASFPEKGDQEIEEIEKRFYRHLADVVVETIKLMTITREGLQKRVSYKNPELLENVAKQGGSFISLAPHYGNWEWLLAAHCSYVAFPVDAVYKPLSSTFFDRLMLRIRTRFGAFPVPSPQIGRVEALRRNIPRGIAMVADQTPGPENAFLFPFLNQQTYFFRGPQKLAKSFSYPVFYANLEKEGRGRYNIIIEEIARPPFNDEEILKTFIEKLERDIRKEPAYWLWSHRRWKHKAPDFVHGDSVKK
jgi:KDO2-lipid IV(A) lauroyltransferase